MKRIHRPHKWLGTVVIGYSSLPAISLAQHVDETIVVTASAGDLAAGDLAQSVTVVSAAELDRVRAANLGETLEGQLGMSASFFGAGSSRPIIRGLAGARVRMMEDGVEAMDVSTVSADHAISVDPLVARQVEIFRGPTTLLYGSGAVGGVVNTVTNRIPEIAPEDGLDAALELRGDTVADERAVSLRLDGGGGRAAWHLDAARREAGDYELPELGMSATDAGAVLGNSDLNLTSYALGGSLLGDNSVIGIAVSGFDSDYGIPSFEMAAEEVRIDLEQSRLDFKGQWLGLSGLFDTISLRLGLSDYSHVEIEGLASGTRFENDAYEARLEVLHAPRGAWSGAFGLQLGERDFSAIGEEAFVPPVDSRSAGVFLLERHEADRWDLELGARLESSEHLASSGERFDDSAISFSIAALRGLGNGYRLALNMALAERLPTAEELFSDGPHLATQTIEIGDAGLDIETSNHFDLGVRKVVGELSWNITLFRTDYDDFIYLGDTGLEDVDEGLPIFEYAQRDATFSGVEAELFAPVAAPGNGEIDLRLFADFVRAELDSGEKVPRIPPRRFGARLSYHTDRYVLGLELTRYDKQDDVAPFEAATAGYTLVGMDLDWGLQTGDEFDLSLFLRGANLRNEEARRHSSFVKSIAPLPGRNFAFGVRLAY